MKKVFVLMVDFDGRMDSQPTPVGVCVESEEEAEDFMNGTGEYRFFKGFDRNYEEVDVYPTVKSAATIFELIEGRLKKV